MREYNRIQSTNRAVLQPQNDNKLPKTKAFHNGKGVTKKTEPHKKSFIPETSSSRTSSSINKEQVYLLWTELSKYSPGIRRPDLNKGQSEVHELKNMLCQPSLNLSHIEESLNSIESSDNQLSKFLDIKKLKNYFHKYPQQSAKRLPEIFFETLADHLLTTRSKKNIRVIKPVTNEINSSDNKENTPEIKPDGIQKKATKLTKNSDSDNTLFNFYQALKKYDQSLQPLTAITYGTQKDVIKQMLSSSKLTAENVRKALSSISENEPWAWSFLEKKELSIIFEIYKDRPIRNLSNFLSSKISQYIEQQNDQEKQEDTHHSIQYQQKAGYESRANQKPNIKRKLHVTRNQEGDIKGNKHFKLSTTSKTIKKTQTVPDLQQPIKHWTNNRVEKNSQKPFTQVQAQSIESSQLFTADLLNTVPDKILKANGWTSDMINDLQEHDKKNPLSRNALMQLGYRENLYHHEREKGRYFGEGSYGKVKFARIHLPDKAEPTWCVAKKILIKRESELQKVLAEARLQSQSGVSVKIYGISNTTNQENKHQCILFMEQAPGKNGHTFINTKHDAMTFNEKIMLAANVLKKSTQMHERSVYHSDMKWGNSSVSNDLSFTVLDFGMGSSNRENHNPYNYKKGYGYNAPEFLAGKKNRRGFMDRSKVDTYNVGIMLGRLFGKMKFMRIKWNTETLTDPQHHIELELAKAGIADPRIKSLISRMIDANPDHRPSMKEALTELNNIRYSA